VDVRCHKYRGQQQPDDEQRSFNSAEMFGHTALAFPACEPTAIHPTD
jgi:hypothetical protein